MAVEFTFTRPGATASAIASTKYTLDGCTEHQNSVMSDLLNSDAQIVRLTGAGGCVDRDTEFLSVDGWKPICEYTSGDLVAQWDPITKQTDYIVPSDYIVDNCLEMTHIQTKTIDMMVSDNHRIPYITSKNNHGVKPTHEILEMATVKIPRDFIPPDSTPLPISDEMLRVLVMQSADGSIVHSHTNFAIRINVKKGRKKERVIKLLTEAGIDYTIYNYQGTDAEEWLKLVYEPPSEIAFKGLESIRNCSASQLKTVGEEIPLWDGSIHIRENVTTFSFTGGYADAEVAQLALTAYTGTYCTITRDPRTYVKQDLYTVSSSSRTTSIVELRGQSGVQNVTTVPTVDGKMYCFTTPSSFWLARRNGKIFPTGNSGKTRTVAAFIQYCIRSKKSIALTGTTHASVAVLTSMVPENYRKMVPTSTIHSYLGMRLVSEAGKDVLSKVKGSKPKPAVEYLLVDEVSMLTGNLMKHLKEAKVLSKIILVGDAVQLTLPGSANLDRYPAYELTVNMRQGVDRPDLLDYLQNLRSTIEANGKVLPELPETSDNITVHSDHYTFLKAYRNSQQQSKVIACFQNKTVKSYNSNVKKYLLEDDNIYSIGDIVYPTSPSFVEGIMQIPNRAVCVIQDVEDCGMYYSLLTDKGVLSVPKGKTVFNDHLSALAEERSWKEYYMTKESYCHVHHLYAGTVFSLQGTTFEDVYIDVTDLLNLANTSSVNNYIRSLYVALSRASKHVHLFIGNVRNYKALGSYTKRGQ